MRSPYTGTGLHRGVIIGILLTGQGKVTPYCHLNRLTAYLRAGEMGIPTTDDTQLFPGIKGRFTMGKGIPLLAAFRRIKAGTDRNPFGSTAKVNPNT